MKKAQLADFAEVLIATAFIVGLGILILMIIGINKEQHLQEVEKSIMFQESTFTTRMLLGAQNNKSNYLYEKIINRVNENNLNGAFEDVISQIKYQTGEFKEPWLIRINDRVKMYNTKKSLGKVILDALPAQEIPNPSGENIYVVIKQITPSDFRLSEDIFDKDLKKANTKAIQSTKV